MKKIICCLLVFESFLCKAQNELNIVPRPVLTEVLKGSFTINKKTTLCYNSKEFYNEIALLSSLIKEKYGFTLKEKFITKEIFSKSGKILIDSNTVSIIQLPSKGLTEKESELYILGIGNAGINIFSRKSINAFYGIQTLSQIFQDNIKDGKKAIQNLSIIDYPRFQYRGIHLDVCRHFFPISFVKKYIDYLAAYKFNKFHWHLTEDQGWRIEIKKYPELTSIGANRNGTLIGRYPGKGNDNIPYGGFYTQAEIKEVVQYAKDRYIEVIPEIEMPGHSSAAIAAYPWLSCFPQKPTAMPPNMMSQKSTNEQKNGRIKLVQETWGVFDDVFCAGKDSTFTFLENVLDEVSALFPSKYIHIGGDESPKTHWKICPACQKRIKDLNLKDEHELQSYFIQRIEKYLNSKGKTIIGWDEILEGGLAPNAVVMSWRGEKGGIEAAKQKHQVIMTPGNPLYFDHTQSKNEDSVTFGGYNPIENVYTYEPASKELNAEEAKYILGAQANMWTEYQSNTRKIEYQLFPRITALSEVLWSPKEKRDWKDFEKRLPVIFERLNNQKVNYSKAYYDPKATVLPTDDYDGVLWKLETKGNFDRVEYSLGSLMYHDGGKSYIYKAPVKILDSCRAIGWFWINPSEEIHIGQRFYFNKATGKKITLTTQADKKYPGDGPFTLVNGVQNEKGMLKSSEFLGFNGTDMEAIIDLGKETDVSQVIVHVLEQNGSWIYLPSQIKVTFIPDVDFTEEVLRNSPSTTRTVDPVADKGAKTISVENIQRCRYIKVTAKNFGIIPPGNPGAGNPAWLFVDEIEVK